MDVLSPNSSVTFGLVLTLITGIVSVTAFVWRFFNKIQIIEAESAANIRAIEGRVTHLETTVSSIFKDVVNQKEAIAVMSNEIKNLKELLEKIDIKLDSLIQK